MSDVPRAVVDTNVFIASIGSTSPFRWLFDALLQGNFRLCLSTPILLEYEEVLADKTTPVVSRNVSGLLRVLPNVIQARPRYRWRLIKADPDDDKFVDGGSHSSNGRRSDAANDADVSGVWPRPARAWGSGLRRLLQHLTV